MVESNILWYMKMLLSCIKIHKTICTNLFNTVIRYKTTKVISDLTSLMPRDY